MVAFFLARRYSYKLVNCCLCLGVNQGGTNCNCCIEACNLVCANVLMNPDYTPTTRSVWPTLWVKITHQKVDMIRHFPVNWALLVILFLDVAICQSFVWSRCWKSQILQDLCHGYMWDKIISQLFQPSSTSVWSNFASNCFKIISEAYCMFSVTEIISAAEIILK